MKKNKNGAKSVNEMENVMPITSVPEATVEMTENPKVENLLESGIPIPAPERAMHKYPFKTMEPGQSFPIPKKSNSASVTIAYWKKKLPGRDFTTRTLGNDEILKLKEAGKLAQDVKEACRIWRVDGLVAKSE